MNVQSAVGQRKPIKLTAASFLSLRQSNAFAAYSKTELLDGELWGVFRQPDDEPESDAEYPIKLTIDQYALLDRSGAFASYRKTELIDGLVYGMSPQYRAHGFVKDEFSYRMRRALEMFGSALHVATEQSVAIAPYSEPQPDIVLTTEPRGLGAIPVESIALIVELAVSTTRFDLGEKAQVYASAEVSEYWVVDVNARVTNQMWDPIGNAYTERRVVAFDKTVKAATIDGLTIDTGGL